MLKKAKSLLPICGRIKSRTEIKHPIRFLEHRYLHFNIAGMIKCHIIILSTALFILLLPQKTTRLKNGKFQKHIFTLKYRLKHINAILFAV